MLVCIHPFLNSAVTNPAWLPSSFELVAWYGNSTIRLNSTTSSSVPKLALMSAINIRDGDVTLFADGKVNMIWSSMTLHFA